MAFLSARYFRGFFKNRIDMKHRVFVSIIIIASLFIPVSSSSAKNNNEILNAVSASNKDYYSGNVVGSINSLNTFLSNIPEDKLYYSQELWMAYSRLTEICITVGDVNCSIHATNRLISIHKSLSKSEQADMFFLKEEINYYVFYNQLLVDNINNLDNIVKSNLLDVYSKPYVPTWYIRNQLLLAKIHLRFRNYKEARLSADRVLAMILSFTRPEEYKSFIVNSLLEVIYILYGIGDTARASNILVTSFNFIGNNISDKEPHALLLMLLVAQHAEFLANVPIVFNNTEILFKTIKSTSMPKYLIDHIYNEVTPRQSVVCILLDNAVCANNSVKLNPLYNSMDNIITYKKIKNRKELMFMGSYVMTQVLINKIVIQDNVINLFLEPLEYKEPDKLLNMSNDSIRYWALGFAFLNKDKHTSSLYFAKSGKIQLEMYENEFSKTESSFLLLGMFQKLILGSAAIAISEEDYREENKLEVLLQIIELYNRGLRNADSDAYIRVLEAKNVNSKRNFNSLYLLNMRKSEIQVKRLAKLIDNINNVKTAPTIADNNVLNFKVFSYLEKYEEQFNVLDYYVSKNNSFRAGIYKLINISSLQNILNDDEVFISNIIFMGQIVHIGVDKHSVYTFNSPVDIQILNNDIKILNMSLRASHPPSLDSDSQYPVESALRLYNIFIKPFDILLIGKKHIIWSPDKDIFDLPLNCLLKSSPTKSKFGYDLYNAEWTISDYAISYVSSAKGFLASRELHSNTYAKYDFLGVGDPLLSGITSEGTSRGKSIVKRSSDLTTRGINDLSMLPETSEELNNISKLFNGQKDLLLQDIATEKYFRQQSLSNYKYIEFATHGLIKNDIKGLEEAALVLTPQTENDESNDGLLTASEISRLNLNAKMVVLSSCNSANYETNKFGSGVQGLTTAFALAGVPTTIASLWPVESKTTQIINTSLYKELKNNFYSSPSIAHHTAINSFLKSDISPEYYHPRFWAPFVVYGDGGNNKSFLNNIIDNNMIEFDKMYISNDNMYGPKKSSPYLKSINEHGFYISAVGDFLSGKASDSLLFVSNDGNITRIFNENHFNGSFLLHHPENNTKYMIGKEFNEESISNPVIYKIDKYGKKQWRYMYIIDNDYSYIEVIGAVVIENNNILVAYWAGNRVLENKDDILFLVMNQDGVELKRWIIKSEIKYPMANSIAVNKSKDTLIISGSFLDIVSVNSTYGYYLIKYDKEIQPVTEIITINLKNMDIRKQILFKLGLIYNVYSDDNNGFYGVGGFSKHKPLNSINVVVFNITKDAETKLLYEGSGPFKTYGYGLIKINNNLAIYGDIEDVWDIESPEENMPWEERLEILFSTDPKIAKQNRNLSTNGFLIIINKDGKLLDKKIFTNGASIRYENGLFYDNNIWIIGSNSNDMMMVKYKYFGK